MIVIFSKNSKWKKTPVLSCLVFGDQIANTVNRINKFSYQICSGQQIKYQIYICFFHLNIIMYVKMMSKIEELRALRIRNDIHYNRDDAQHHKEKEKIHTSEHPP